MPCRWGREAGLPVALLSLCPGLSKPPPSLRILSKFLDSYQEDVLPWHECVEPCVSCLSTHSSSWEVRGPRDCRQAGVAVLAVPQLGPALGKQGPTGGSLAFCPSAGRGGSGCPGHVHVLVAAWPCVRALGEVGVAVLAMSISWWPHAQSGHAWPGSGERWWGWDEGNGAAALAAGGPRELPVVPWLLTAVSQ